MSSCPWRSAQVPPSHLSKGGRGGVRGIKARNPYHSFIGYWLIFHTAVGIAMFAGQSSSASPVILKFLIWKFEISLVYAILGSTALGILFTFFFGFQEPDRHRFGRKGQITRLLQPEHRLSKGRS
jgi:uncharacterized integral membrane protein